MLHHNLRLFKKEGPGPVVQVTGDKGSTFRLPVPIIQKFYYACRLSQTLADR